MYIVVIVYHFDNIINYDANLTQINVVETNVWRTQIEIFVNDNRIIYSEVTKNSLREYKKIQEHFNNTRYQRENIQKFCETLSIEWKSSKTIIYRIQNKTLS